MPKRILEFFEDQSGQAIVEYVLLLAMALAVLTGMRISIKRITGKIWSLIASKIAAPCAECSPEDDFRI